MIGSKRWSSQRTATMFSGGDVPVRACSSAPKLRMSSSSRRAWFSPAHSPVRANRRSWW